MYSSEDTKERFGSLDPDEQDTVLNIGMLMYEHGRRGLTDVAVATERERIEAQIRVLEQEAYIAKETHHKELQTLREETKKKERELLAELEARVNEREDHIYKLKEESDTQIRLLEQEAYNAKETHFKKLQALQEQAKERERELRDRFREEVEDRVNQLVGEREAVLRRELLSVREHAVEERKRMSREHEEAIERLRELGDRATQRTDTNEKLLQKELTRVNEQAAEERRRMSREHEDLMERLREVTGRLMGTAENSSKRGKMGEVVAAEEVRRVFHDATEIEDMASEGGCGDIHVTLTGIGKIILDIKHHEKGSGGVRKKDRDKLLRDIDDDKNDAVGGILVATQASIQGMESGSILWSPKYHRPMVACELRGDWTRLIDSRNVLRTICEVKRLDTENNPREDTTGWISPEDVAKPYTQSIEELKKLRNGHYEQILSINHTIGYMLISRAKLTGNPVDIKIMEDWLLEKYHNQKGIMNLKKIYEEYEEKASVKKISTRQKQSIRDILVKLGAKIT